MYKWPLPYSPRLCTVFCALHLTHLSKSLTDLSSTIIPVDDDEDEENYDDIEPNSPLQQPNIPQNSKQGGEEDWEAKDESEEIYEELPGMRGRGQPAFEPPYCYRPGGCTNSCATQSHKGSLQLSRKPFCGPAFFGYAQQQAIMLILQKSVLWQKL